MFKTILTLNGKLKKDPSGKYLIGSNWVDLWVEKEIRRVFEKNGACEITLTIEAKPKEGK